MQVPELTARPRQFSLQGRTRHFLSRPMDHDYTMLVGVPLMLLVGAVIGLMGVFAAISLVAAFLNP